MHKKPHSEKLAELTALAGRTMVQIDRLAYALRKAGISEGGYVGEAYSSIGHARQALAMQQIAAKAAEHEAWMADCRERDARMTDLRTA